jgi:hypothetical protein
VTFLQSLIQIYLFVLNTIVNVVLYEDTQLQNLILNSKMHNGGNEKIRVHITSTGKMQNELSKMFGLSDTELVTLG